MVRILIAEPLAEAGVELLRAHYEVDARAAMTREELLGEVAGADALVVRSATRVDAEVLEAGRNLKVVARAGIGLDNVDVAAATRLGVLVVNAPQSNVISAAEHTVALVLAQARNIPQAHARLREGHWERARFQGAELYGKTLGIVGLGRVGALVAQRLNAFGMRLLAYDPYVSRDRATQMGVELASLTEVLARSDIVTIHLPKTVETTGLIGERELAAMKPGARLVNTARGGIVDELALAKAVESGHLAGAALDVFAEEPTTSSPLVEKLGRLYSGLASGGPSGRAAPVGGGRLNLEYVGGLAEHDTRVLTLAALKGLFTPVVSEPVTFVNAPLLASERGIEVVETKTRSSKDWVNLVTMSGEGARGPVSVAGTTVGARDAERLVEINRIPVDLAPADYMAFLFYEDKPGVIGKVGTILGQAGVNIASMQVGRRRQGGEALMALTVDSVIPPGVLDRVMAEVGAHDGSFLQLHDPERRPPGRQRGAGA